MRGVLAHTLSLTGAGRAAWRTWASQAGTIYSGPQAPLPAQVTLRTLQQKHAAAEPISMVTAYDYPSAVHVRQQKPWPAGRAERVVPAGG